ncbi:hypothetical protein WKW23_12620 [Vibrio alginolyticus]|uniref:hypothetical protein n=1 Tax=Vibrio alginolyticus TaxID=663 RepID=UPI002FC0C880
MDITSDLICTYLSQHHVLSVQQMVNAKLIVNSKDEPTHVQGWCSITSSPRTLRVDHILNIHESLSEAETFFREAKAKLEESGFEFDVPKSNRLSSPNTMDVCFTGFAKDDKAELMSKAESKEMMVRQSVTRHLDILCYGYNAGPKKLEKALAQGVMILNRHQFENLLETGEVPEDV